MGGQNQHLGYLDMSGCVGGIDGHVCDVIASQRLDAFIDIGGTVVVAMKADVAEIRLYEAGLQVGDADSSVGHVNAQAVVAQ